MQIKTGEDGKTVNRATLINDIIGTGIETDADAFLSEYTPKQLAVNRAYRDYLVANNKYSNEEMYLFVLPEGKAPDKNKLGDMPLGKQWGYLFGTPTARTLAHELGHGKTKLEHTFADDKITQGSTTNLMDYLANDSLVRYQWQNIHDPAVFDPVQSDEDGALIKDDKEVEWVVELYSPQVSAKFIEAKKNNDVAEMKRLIDWALKHQFTDDWLDKVKIGFTLESDRAVATLKHNKDAKFKGLRLYYTKSEYGSDGKLIGVYAKNDPLYFTPTSGSNYAINFPVDVTLYKDQTGRVNINLTVPEVIADVNIK